MIGHNSKLFGLLDSGAIGSCINRDFVMKNGIQTEKMPIPLPVYNADSSQNSIGSISEYVTVRMTISEHSENIQLAVTDLEKMAAPNGKAIGGVGDVALKHFKELRGFEQYKQYYVKREDAQAIFEKEASKRSSRFTQYIDASLFTISLLYHTNLRIVSASNINLATQEIV